MYDEKKNGFQFCGNAACRQFVVCLHRRGNSYNSSRLRVFGCGNHSGGDGGDKCREQHGSGGVYSIEVFGTGI